MDKEYLKNSIHYWYDSKSKSKNIASKKANEVAEFYLTSSNDIFVANDGNKLLGFIDNLGEYEYEPDLPFYHTKKGTWHLNLTIIITN